MDWDQVKKKGNPNYKGENVEPIDLLKDGGMLRDFALGSIIKYAYRNRNRLGVPINRRDMEKVIHYSEILLAIKEKRGGR